MSDIKLELLQLLKEVAENEGITDYKIESTDGSTKGDGYIGLTSAITITGKAKDGIQDKVLNLFVKSATDNEILRKKVMYSYMFKREVLLYNQIFQSFSTLEIDNNLKPLSFAPKMYNFNLIDKQEAIIMENLKEHGFKLYNYRVPMDEKHVTLVMEHYGRFHALSFALRHLRPDAFQEFSNALDGELLLVMKHNGFVRNTFIEKLQTVSEMLQKDSNVDRKIVETFKTRLDNLEEEYQELAVETDRHSVVLHGDGWTNNMMFKYELKEDPDKPTSVNFFDYQLSRLGSPILDLSYFFYTCSSKEIINDWKHYHRIYYFSFSEYLKKFGCNAEELFPYEIFEKHWKRYARYGLLFTALVIFLMLSEKHEVVSFEETMNDKDGITKSFNYQISKINEYYDRMKHIVIHLIENDFL